MAKMNFRVRKGRYYSVSFDVLTAVKMSMLVFWVVTPYEFVGR
jgi:hypothetical protein